ncbi:MAG: ATP synthase subunit C [Pseudomonadota bacterium]
MSVLIALMVLCVASLVVTGLWLGRRHRPPPAWLKGGVVANLILFALALAGTLFLGADPVLAEPVPGPQREIDMAYAVALFAVGLPTGLAAIAAAWALSSVGAAALAVLAEKPELFGRTLVYMGLAEGIAIYGLVMSILMLGKL